MTRPLDNWPRLKEVFADARALPVNLRPAYLAGACGGDEALRHEVESLLASDTHAKSFLETPALLLADTMGAKRLEGRRVGPYQITSWIGAGGMGEVYRARDARLGRDVAIKILPPIFAGDPERISRFDREARMLGSLNHPHIGAIYGVEQSDGVPALILELVEGPTLADRLGLGPIPLTESLEILRQLADAMEAAHARGIVHRDLKPANIKITPDGTVKVLDFGVGKPDEADGEVAPDDLLRGSPVAAGDTRGGVILGTPSYMSPEQARGSPVDKRTDIWAFGCVLYEMLTGRLAFAGETVSDHIAAILQHDPDWTKLPETTPPDLRRVLRRCLAKDPTRRLQAIGDARLEIEELLSGASEESTGAVPSQALPTRRRAVPWVVAGALAVALLLVLWTRWRISPPLMPLRLSVELGADVSMSNAIRGAAMGLSGDGAVVAFVGPLGATGTEQLYVQPLNQLQATPLPGTEGARSPFFSPDGQWIGFFAGGRLKKVSITGGATVTLGDAPSSRGGAWSEDGTIVFTPGPPLDLGLRRVPSAGGQAETLTPLAEGEVTQRWPQALPGGKGVLFTSSRDSDSYDDATLVVQRLPTGPRKAVLHGGSHGRYLPSGHLVYMAKGTLFAVPFDLDRLEVMGPPVPALDNVMSNATSGSAQFAVSASGTLVYLPGRSTSAGIPVHWMDRQGTTTPLRSTPANWFDLHFSPDGQRLAMAIVDGLSNIWVYDLARDTSTRLTSDPVNAQSPVWTPDGRRIGFASARADKSTFNLYWQRADGTGDAQRLTESKNQQYPGSWHPSGRFLAFWEQNPTTNWDLMILPMAGDDVSGWKPGQPYVFLNSPDAEETPIFSPDGRWLAYTSRETGRVEVYVRPFPGPGGKTQISSGGGSYPTWSAIKHEIFYGTYGTLDTHIMVAGYSVEGDSFRTERPRRWSEARYVANRPWRIFDLHPDGERFAIGPGVETPGSTRQDKAVFIFNFSDELRRIAPAR